MDFAKDCPRSPVSGEQLLRQPRFRVLNLSEKVMNRLSCVFRFMWHELQYSCTRSAPATALIVGAFALLPNAYGVDLPDSTNRLVYSGQVNSEYIGTFNLELMRGRSALQTMLNEGFRCRIQVGNELVAENINCSKRPSGFAPLCDDLITTVYFEHANKRVPGIETREDLYRKLDTLKVVFYGSFCPYPRQASTDFLSTRESGEKLLRHKLDDMKLIGNVQQAFDKLLVDGFYCGFASEEKEGVKVAQAKMVCNKLPSRIQGCFNARVSFDVNWPVGTHSFKQLYASLPQAAINSMSSDCEIPQSKKGEAS